MEAPSVGDTMAAYAEDAVEHAKTTCGITLDYSADSIRQVEDILERLYAAMPRGFLGRLFGRKPSDDDVWTICKMYGGYIGEVVRRVGGGEWFIDTEIAPGAQVIALRKGEGRMFPPSKVRKRLTNGPEDNVWFYFQVLMSEHWR